MTAQDLFVELAKLASNPNLDHILIESSGISEPMPVAETFTFKDQAGTSLNDIARLDTLVTVVDGASFLDELHAAEELRARGWQAGSDDERTVAQLFCDQLEFANVIIMNKMDLMDDAGRMRLRATLRRFNPGAELIEATHGCVNPKQILGTGLFSMDKAEQHPEWLKEARTGEHVPESDEYGISSFIFRSSRPLDSSRFKELTAAMETRGGEHVAQRVIRTKGLVWLATRRSHWQMGMASLAGSSFSIHFGGLWDAALASGIGPLKEDAPYGDRRTELVVIGQDMDHAGESA